MNNVFEVVDKSGRKIKLTKERWKHIKKHPHMDENRLEDLKTDFKRWFN